MKHTALNESAAVVICSKSCCNAVASSMRKKTVLTKVPSVPFYDHNISSNKTFNSNQIMGYIEGILPKGPYLPCVSMAGRALLAGYHRYVPNETHRTQWKRCCGDTHKILLQCSCIILSYYKAISKLPQDKTVLKSRNIHSQLKHSTYKKSSAVVTCNNVVAMQLQHSDQLQSSKQ